MAQRIILFCGPRAAGKGMLVDAILQAFPVFTHLVRHTTRPRRKEEKHGVHYYFLGRLHFLLLIAFRRLLWSLKLGKYRYGLAKSVLRAAKFAVTDVGPDQARVVKRIIEARGGKVFLIAVLASEEDRIPRAQTRANLTRVQACELIATEIASTDPVDYADFDLVVENSGSDPEPAKSQVIKAVRQFLQGSEP